MEPLPPVIEAAEEEEEGGGGGGPPMREEYKSTFTCEHNGSEPIQIDPIQQLYSVYIQASSNTISYTVYIYRPPVIQSVIQCIYTGLQ